MPENVQADRPLTIDTPLGKDMVLLRGLSGREGVSQLFGFELDLIAENKTDVAFDKVLGQKVTAHLSLLKGKRHFNGRCVRISQGERDEGEKTFTAYRMEIVPDFWMLTRKAQSRIFQQMSVPDILKKVLVGFDVTYELQGTFYPRDYCVQYRETDFNFASRMMEEEGIYYFFKHTDGNHTMVVANTPQSHSDVPGPTQIIYEDVAGGFRHEDRISSWEKVKEWRSGKYTLWDHSFELPHKHLETEKLIQESVTAGKVSHKLKVSGNDKFEIYDWPGEYAQRFDGVDPGGGDQPGDLQHIFEDNSRTVNIRMQEEALASLVIHGGGNCRHFMAGHKFSLQRHFSGEGGPYVLTSVHHDARGSGDFRAGQTGEFRYHNDFTCIPQALPFRPLRLTPKPVVHGTQSAVVVGPPGEEIFTDKYSRVKVQFHWDREGKHDSKSSCWVRVGQPIAGRRWGASFWPRIGQEVIVDFLEGDPDQPIIVGSVYNADQMPPYLGNGPDSKHKNDNKLTGVKSNTTPGGEGYNEWRFDDTKGKQQIFLHAERNMDVRVKSEAMESVGGDKHLTVGGEKDGSKWGDFREFVYKDRHIHIKGSHEENVEGSVGFTVGHGDDSNGGTLHMIIEKVKVENIGEDSHLTVGGKQNVKVKGDASLKIEGSRQEKVTQRHALDAGQEIHLKGGTKVVIEGGAQLSLKVGGNFIDISPAGVTISGTMVLINSGGAAGSGSGSSPEEPLAGTIAQPKKPTPADDAKTGSKSC
jgi:type VI secretion system secreted protein VgrG